MKDQIKRCPHCNSLVKGVAKRGVTQGAGQGFAKGVINSMTFGVGGTLLDATGVLTKAGDAIRESVTESTTVVFECACGHSWEEIIGNNEENIPDEILRKEKNAAIFACESKVSSKRIGAIVFGIACALCVWYLIVNPLIVETPDHNWLMGDFVRKDYQWGWIGMFFLACITGVPAIFYLSSYSETKGDLKYLKPMSLKAFKTSYLRKKYK